jgi:hypothetical protein
MNDTGIRKRSLAAFPEFGTDAVPGVSNSILFAFCGHIRQI